MLFKQVSVIKNSKVVLEWARWIYMWEALSLLETGRRSLVQEGR
jgi:hypothetical protein